MKSLAHYRQRIRSVATSAMAPLLAVVFCVIAGMGMVWSVLAVYAQSLGAGATLVGTMIACFGGARLVINLPSGIASERFGRRRTMMAGLAVLALSSFLAAGARGVTTLIGCLLLQGVGSSIYMTAALSAIADLGSPDSRVRDMSIYQGATMIGLSVGPGLGGLAASAWGYTAPFLLQGAMALVALIAMSRVRESRDLHGTGPAPVGISLRAGGLIARMAVLALMTYCVFFTRIAANWILLPLIVEENLHVGAATIGLMLTAGAIANVLALPATAFAAGRFGRKTVLITANIITVGALALLIATAAAPLAWLSAILIGLGTGMSAPMLTAYAADAAPKGRMGAAMGLLRTMTDIGIVTGPIVIGLAVDRLGFGNLGGTLVCGVVLTLSTLVFTLSTPTAPPADAA